MVTVVLRYDDYEMSSDTDLEQKILEALRLRGQSAVFGVVPFSCVDPENGSSDTPLSADTVKAGLLRNAVADGVVEAALHGYCHAQRHDEKGRKTEFRGQPLDVQQRWIRQGAEELHLCTGEQPTTFIPPFNSYDPDTIRALEHTGLHCLSASMFGPALTETMVHLCPQSCSLLQLRHAVEAARLAGGVHPVVALFHQYDFVENDSQRGCLTFAQFENLLDWLAGQEDVAVRTIRNLQRDGLDLGTDRYVEQQRFLNAVLHPWCAPDRAHEADRWRLLSATEALNLRRRIVGRTVGAYLGAALLAAMAGFVVGSSSFAGLMAGASWLLASAVWVGYRLKKRERFYFRSVMVSIVLFFLGLGGLAA